MDEKDYVPAFRTYWIIALVILICGTAYMFYNRMTGEGLSGSGHDGSNDYLYACVLGFLTLLFLLSGIDIFRPVKKKR